MGPILLDVYGTILRGPPSELLVAVLEAHDVSKSSRLGQRCLRGSGCAPLLHACELSWDDAMQRSLTANVTRPEGLWELLGMSSPLPQPVLRLTQALLELHHHHSRLLPGAQALLDGLKSRGALLALVTNIDGPSRETLRITGLTACVDALVPSCESGSSKPASAIFADAAGQLGIAVEAVTMIGDEWRSDVIGALRVGGRSVYIDRGRDPVVRVLLSAPPEVLTAMWLEPPQHLKPLRHSHLPAPTRLADVRWRERVVTVSTLSEVLSTLP